MKKKFLLLLVLILTMLNMYAQTKIVAHRGFSGVAPENTLSAFSQAIEIGADYFELDVHMTKDSVVVVIHDEEIERTTSGDFIGNVRELEFAELKNAKVGYSKKFGEQFINEPIPTLHDALKFAKGKIKVCVEIKQQGIEKEVLQVIEELDMEQEVVIFSFYADVVENMLKLNKNVPTLYLSTFPKMEVIETAKKLGTKKIGVGIYKAPSKKFIESAHQQGIEVWVWTVNEPAKMQKMKERNVDGLITNYPDKAMLIGVRNK